MKTINEQELSVIMRAVVELSRAEREQVKAEEALMEAEVDRDSAKFALGEVLESVGLDVAEFFQKHIIGQITSS